MPRNSQIQSSDWKRNMVNRGEPCESQSSEAWSIDSKKTSDQNFQLVFRKDGIGDGTHFHLVSFCPHRLSKSFTEAWTKKELSIYTSTALWAAFLRDCKFLQHWGKSEPPWNKESSWGHCFLKLQMPWGWPSNLSQHPHIPDEASLNSFAPSCWMPGRE